MSGRRFGAASSFAITIAVAAGCSVGGAASTDHSNLLGIGNSAPPEWDRPVTRPASEVEASAARQACAFQRGSMPAETVGSELPVDGDIPIQNIVVLMQENRSFDSYFGHLGKWVGRTDIESADEATTLPSAANDPNSASHPWQHAPMLCISDTNHEWAGSHVEYDNGLMDGFFQANDGFFEKGEPTMPASALTGARSVWWYDETDIPFYYQLAATFAIGDHYHASLLGPTYPNRDYLYGASSRGVVTSDYVDMTGLGFPGTDVLIFDELTKRGITWDLYVNDIPHVARLNAFLGPNAMTERLLQWGGVHIWPLTQFYIDAKLGRLPQVAFVDGSIEENVNGNDEHPPSDIQNGQKFVSDVVHSVFGSPQWSQLALFVTYDEHGGIYDHVAPPPACPPDDLPPNISTDPDNAQFPGAFDRLGVRVPFIAVSPFTKAQYVSHHVYDHTSITRFIEAKFKLPALTARDANADPLFDFFDFGNPPFLTPPDLIEATVDAQRYQDCKDLFGGTKYGSGSGLPFATTAGP